MGFLDHSTNNITLDAVLTREGRRQLALGTLDVDGFALSDDEVDYSIITQYGRTVGKEKIEKNTPVFEALTNGSNALKHKLLTVTNNQFQNTFFLPLGSFEGSVSNDVLALRTNNQTTNSVIYRLTMNNDDTIPAQFQGGFFTVILNTNLLSLGGGTPDFTLADGTGVYDSVTVTSNTNTAQEININLNVVSALENLTTFNLYKTSSDSFVRTFVKFVHNSSGVSKILEVQISRPQ